MADGQVEQGYKWECTGRGTWTQGAGQWTVKDVRERESVEQRPDGRECSCFGED